MRRLNRYCAHGKTLCRKLKSFFERQSSALGSMSSLKPKVGCLEGGASPLSSLTNQRCNSHMTPSRSTGSLASWRRRAESSTSWAVCSAACAAGGRTVTVAQDAVAGAARRGGAGAGAGSGRQREGLTSLSSERWTLGSELSASSSVFEPARRVAITNSHLLPSHWSHLNPSLAPLRVSMTCCSAARLGCTASRGLASATCCSAVFGWC